MRGLLSGFIRFLILRGERVGELEGVNTPDELAKAETYASGKLLDKSPIIF